MIDDDDLRWKRGCLTFGKNGPSSLLFSRIIATKSENAMKYRHRQHMPVDAVAFGLLEAKHRGRDIPILWSFIPSETTHKAALMWLVIHFLDIFQFFYYGKQTALRIQVAAYSGRIFDTPDFEISPYISSFSLGSCKAIYKFGQYLSLKTIK